MLEPSFGDILVLHITTLPTSWSSFLPFPHIIVCGSCSSALYPSASFLLSAASSLSHTHTTLSHTTLSHTTVPHTHTKLCHTQLLLLTLSRTRLSHTQHCHTHNSVTHTSFKHKSFRHNSVTQLPSHTLNSFTYNAVSHHSSTPNSVTYTNLLHASLSRTALSHDLSSTISFVFPDISWKQLTCGVIWSFIIFSCLRSLEFLLTGIF